MVDFYGDCIIELERYFRNHDSNSDAKRECLYKILKQELKRYVQKQRINFPQNEIDLMAIEDVIKEIQEIGKTFRKEEADDLNRKKKYVLYNLLERYVNLQRKRLLPCCKREVHISKELKAKIDNKEIPEKICEVIKCIRQELQNGIDVSPRLSKGARKIGEKYDDTLLNEFSIYHFHLSNEKKDNAKSYERTNELLFVYIPINDNNNAYFLNVVDNHINNEVFADIGLLQLIENNWPFLLDPYTFRNIKNSGSLSISTNEQYRSLRKICVNSSITLEDKKEVMKPGLGRMINGKSIYTKLATTRVMKQIAWLENLCKKKMQENPNIDFKLKLTNNNIFEIICIQNKY